MERLDLERPRALGELLGTTFALQRRWFAVFFAVTATVNVPVVLLVDGVWGRQFENGPDGGGPAAATFASFVLGVVVVGAVAALHARIVEGLSRGEEPTFGAAFRLARSAVGPAAATTALYFLGFGVGLLLLIVPGIYLMVRWYVAPQAAVIEGLGASDALARSSELVAGRWWVVCGRTLVVAIITGLLVAVPISVAGYALDDPFLYMLASAVLGTAGQSIAGLFGTLLFFSLRAERPPTPEPPSRLPELPPRTGPESELS